MNNLKYSKTLLRAAIEEKDALEFFKMIKFDRCIVESLSGEPENLIEVINQCMTITTVMSLIPKFAVAGGSLPTSFSMVVNYDI